MKITIGADLAPTDTNKDIFESGNIESIIDEKILDVLRKADFRIFNLETPLADAETPIDKRGPGLIAPVKTVNGIKKINPSLLTISNNHILDQGAQGLFSTVKALDDAKIEHIGAGKNLEEARNGCIYEKDGIKVGVYACCEHEFSVAADNTPGANPFDPLESLDHISNLKLHCDYLIVLYHGGKEYYRYPSPYLKKVCRKICDKGADFVICQHSHCIGCKEEYEGSTIVYGQGNFLFNLSDNECWQTSLLIELDLQKESSSVKYYPLAKNGNGVKMAENRKSLDGFEERSMEIKNNPEIINEKYEKLASETAGYYLSCISGETFFKKLLVKLFGLNAMKKYYKKKDYYTVLNYINCEAHREFLDCAVKQCLKEEKIKAEQKEKK